MVGHYPLKLIDGVHDGVDSHLCEVHYVAHDSFKTPRVLLVQLLLRLMVRRMLFTSRVAICQTTAKIDTWYRYLGFLRSRLTSIASTSDTFPIPVIEKYPLSIMLIRLSAITSLPCSRAQVQNDEVPDVQVVADALF